MEHECEYKHYIDRCRDEEYIVGKLIRSLKSPLKKKTDQDCRSTGKKSKLGTAV